MKKTAVIFGAGEPNIKQVNLPADCLVWAADGGLAYCNTLGITPDFIIGDFDSLGYVPENAVILPVQKDLTDLEAAVTDAEEKGCDEFYIYGGTGNRLDHTLGNIALLIALSKKGKRAFLCDCNYTVTAVTNGEIHFDADERGTVSVFAADKEVHGVTIRGLLYELQNATLTNDVTLGVSNELTGQEASVGVTDGTLVIVKTNITRAGHM